MAQNFVVTFGGSGARCAEALVYAAASRVASEPMQVLLIDPDQTNWNVMQAVNQCRRYQEVQRRVESPAGGEAPFFSTPLNTNLGADSFVWSNPQPHTPFSTLIEYATLDRSEKALVDLLYEESDLEMTFEKGYIGRAHVGSLDLLRVLRTNVAAAAQADSTQDGRRDALQQFFRGLREAAQRPGGARLLVIGSVFGGTGASGLPALPPMLRESLLAGVEQEIAIGCVQLAPYFSFPQGGPEDPDSTLHPLATQAALYHYALTDVGYDRVYLLGSPDREHASQKNVAGGEAQRNRAHYVELGAALAAVHFFSDTNPRGAREVYASGADAVNWQSLPSGSTTTVRRNLVAFTTACMLHGMFFAKLLEQGKHVGSAWERRLRQKVAASLGGQESELLSLRDFSTRYLSWAQDFQRYHDVALFNLGNETRSGALGRLGGDPNLAEPYHELVLRLNRIGDLPQQNAVGWYVAALTQASLEFCRENYARWWRAE